MHSLAYNADEIFEIAEQIERNGAAFYRRAAACTSMDDARDFLLTLADQEDRHVQTFAALRNSAVADGKRVANFDQDETVAAYLRALAGQFVFRQDADPADILSGQETADEILKMAIAQEKDAIVLYLGLMDALADSGEATAIRGIVREEQRHLTDLLQKLAARA